MAFADEQNYEDMIEDLQRFLAEVNEQCDIMISAGQSCIDNTDDDPAAVKSNEKLQGCVTGIFSSLESIQRVIVALQDEMEDIREAAAKADSY